jgi:hypothetical protein
MKTTTRFLLAASTALAMALTFSACSDDKDDGPSYGTCDEAKVQLGACWIQAYSDPTYIACTINPEKTEEECDDEIADPIMNACAEKSAVCGGASAEQCGDHFFEACPDFLDLF